MELHRLEIRRPDDWHVHFRDGLALGDTVRATASVFGRAIAMPNLRPPIRTVAEAAAYRDRIVAALPEGVSFEPLMTLYLTQRTSPRDVEEAARSPFVHAIKLYPAGATTNAEAGVTDPHALGDVFAAMERTELPLLVHAESVDPEVDVFDRERVFLERTLEPLCRAHPRLRVVVEHITTREAVEWVDRASDLVAATITVHHLLYNRGEIFRGGLRPHFYCLPVLKREAHRRALVAAAISGSPKYFLGTDSAPHPREAKESECGCAGIYTAHAAMPLYAEAFEAAGALDRLEGFASLHGPRFYRLPIHDDRIALERGVFEIPSVLPLGDTEVVPLRAGDVVKWRVVTTPSVHAGD